VIYYAIELKNDFDIHLSFDDINVILF